MAAATVSSSMIPTPHGSIVSKREKEWRTRISPNANLLAGGFGGLCSLVIGYPFDTVKVRLQTSKTSTYKNSFDCLSKILFQEGCASLFRGISGLVLVALPRFALMFHSNTVARNLLMKPEVKQRKPDYFRVMLSGAFSQLLVVPLIVAPLERIKVIMQTNSQVKSQWACLKNILYSEGPRGVFKGILVTYARDMPSFATYFMVYDFLRHNFKNSNLDIGPVGTTIVSGATAGIAGWLVAIPADVIKNRHQACQNSKSAISTTVQLFKSQGIRGFFLGAGPILLRAGPANAAAFLGYEFALKSLSYFYND